MIDNIISHQCGYIHKCLCVRTRASVGVFIYNPHIISFFSVAANTFEFLHVNLQNYFTVFVSQTLMA